jgi:hypothetical protein
VQFRNTTYYEVTEAADSPQEEFAADDARVTQVVDITPGTLEKRQQAALDFIGYATIVLGQAGGGGKNVLYISRQTPMPYVVRPIDDLNRANRPLYCTGMPTGQGKGVGKKHPQYNTTNYDLYRATLTFSALPCPVKEDAAVVAQDSDNPLKGFPDEGEALQNSSQRYISRSIDYGNRLLQIRGSMFFYVETLVPGRTPTPIPEGVPFPDNFLSITYNWFGVPREAFNRDYAFKSLNCVNHKAFDGFPAECLLFAGVKETPRRGPLNDPLLDISFSMKAVYHPSRTTVAANPPVLTPLGWNGLLRNLLDTFNTNTKILDYVRVTSNGTATGTPPFSLVDFRKLFQPAQP